MSLEQVLTSAVVLAHDVNLSIFKPDWLSRTGVFSDDDILEGYVITPAMVRIPTVRCELLVLPGRIQWRPSPNLSPTSKDVIESLGKIVEELPHTPFESVGLNFEFLASPPDGTEFGEWARNWAVSKLSATLAGQDSTNRFGTTLTMKYLDFVLQVDTRSVRMADSGSAPETGFAPGSEALKLKFNYHQSLQGETRAQDILVVLGKLEDALAHSDGLLQAAFGE